MRITFTAILFVLIAGCSNNSAEIKVFSTQLDLPKYAQELVNNMSGRKIRISKTFVLNELSETKVYSEPDSVFWIKELTMLANIDLNSPQLSGSFKIKKASKDQFSNLLIDNYAFSFKDDTGIKNLSVYYLDDPKDIRHIKAELTTKNLISQSNSKLSIWVNRYGAELLIDSLEIISQDKTLMQPVRNYRSITSVLR
jgi:hypothetical protein